MPLAKKIERKYSYQDYILWPDNERWEIIDGDAYNMSPAPGTRHQLILNNLNIILSKSEKMPVGCRVFIAPTDVVLSEHDMVQPDIFIVCDKTKITEKNIQGSPELVIEVLSPNTALKDKREKKSLYQEAGVQEYIIVDPIELYVERFSLSDNGEYAHSEIFGAQESLPLKLFAGVEIPLWEVFEVER
jgi:Uma2 family endonuclease